MLPDCKHIFSYEEGAADESWLNYEPKQEQLREYFSGIPFRFCPLCGEELIVFIKEEASA